jgi:hypothetical protein
MQTVQTLFTFTDHTVSLPIFENKYTASDMSFAGRAPFDGWADDTTEPGQYKDYYYPNAQAARTLWYHDHAAMHTAENAYYGQAGFYILEDDHKNGLKLPSGDYDIPLALAAKRYNADGTLWDPEANGETVSVFGDVIQVNGQPWLASICSASLTLPSVVLSSSTQRQTRLLALAFLSQSSDQMQVFSPALLTQPNSISPWQRDGKSFSISQNMPVRTLLSRTLAKSLQMTITLPLIV